MTDTAPIIARWGELETAREAGTIVMRRKYWHVALIQFADEAEMLAALEAGVIRFAPVVPGED